jgi:hypothetical protein
VGAVASVEGTALNLAGDPVYPTWAKEDTGRWKRAVVCVMDGRGAGQVRGVAANHGRAIGLDRPFDIAPDATTVICLVPLNGRALVIGNQFEDANWVNAGFGTAIDVIYAENRLRRCAQLLNYGLGTPGSLMPNLYVQYLDNDLGEGLCSADTSGSVRGGMNYGGPVTRVTVQRRNHFAADNAGGVSVTGRCADVLVEGCRFEHPESTVRVDAAVRGVLLRANRFAGAPRYDLAPGGDAVVAP